MWGNEDKGHAFMFPPVQFGQNLGSQNDLAVPSSNDHVAGQYHGKGRGGKRSRGNHNPGGFRSQHGNKAYAQFYCDRCDRAFESDPLLAEHYAQHKTEHDTGFDKKITSLNIDEENEEWRNERNRKFPTVAKIIRLEAEQAKMVERGEVIPSEEFGKFKGNRGRSFQRGNMRGRGRSWRTSRSDRMVDRGHSTGRMGHAQWMRTPYSQGATNSDEPSISKDYFGWNEDNSLKRFTGTVASIGAGSHVPSQPSRQIGRTLGENTNGDLISDSEDEITATNEESPIQCPTEYIPKALKNLVTAYLSDSEEETSRPITPNAKTTKPDVVNKPKTTNRPRATKHQHFQPQTRFTLLEMLLSKEIQQERNKIFQCVRYIVNNEFFGIH